MQVHNCRDGLLRQLTEDKKGVESVDQFGWDVFRGAFQDCIASVLRKQAIPLSTSWLSTYQRALSKITRQLDDGILMTLISRAQ